MTILHIDSSILGGYSVSRMLSSEIVARQKALHPYAKVIYRDLVVDGALHLSDRHMAMFQGAEVTDPPLGVDLAAGKTFRYTENGPEGLLPKGKKVLIAASRGGIYTGDSPAAVLEHHETYLKGVLSFIGLTDITVVRAEGLNLGEDSKAAPIAKARTEIAALAA